MRDPPSIADALMATGVHLDGRYRLDALVRRSATITIHVAMHRNGSTAWLKLPVTAAHADLITSEGRIANTIGSPLVVRDDGTTPDGVAYLVLDPPDAESVATLRERGRKGTRLPLARVMTAGDALARVVAAIHGMGLVTAGLADEDVLVFSSGDVALLDLHAVVPATPAGIAADVKHVLRIMNELVADVADTSSRRAASARTLINGALAAAYPDIVALQAAWRAAAPEPIALPSRVRPGTFADIATAPVLPKRSTPPAMAPTGSLRPQPPRDPDGSVIGFLRTAGAPPSVPRPQVSPSQREVMYDPLAKVTDMPRLVHATSRPAAPKGRSSMSPWLVGASIVAPIMAVIMGVVFLRSPPTSAHAPPVAKSSPRAPVPPAPLPVPTPVPPVPAVPPPLVSARAPTDSDDELELTAVLRTEGAPPDREVLIDGKVVGITPLSVTVPCGRHMLQMVASAPKQAVELPCGGERVVRYDAKGRWALRAE
jgi:hypothetical protein